MAPLPHNDSDIYYLDYNTGTVDHTLMCRTQNGVSDGDAINAIDDFLTAVSPFLSTITVVGLRYQAEGTSFSNPVTWTGSSTYGSGTPDRQNEASFVSFVGRDTTGHRVRVAVFGAGLVNNLTNFRSPAGASADVQNALDVLEAPDGCFYSINEGAPAWKQYMNIGLSAYWQRQFR